MADKRTFVYDDFQITYEETAKGWSMPYAHHHTHYEIYVLLTGERRVTIGDATHRVLAGIASLFESNIPHKSVGDTDYSGICIHFSKAFLERFFLPDVVSHLLSIFQSPLLFIPKDYQKKLLSLAGTTGTGSPTAYLLLAQILTELREFQHKYPPNMNNSFRSNKSSGPARILNYMDANYTAIQSVQEIATSCGVSQAYIHRVVKQETSLTVKEYINRLRLRHAVHEMEYSDNSLALISRVCGFQSVSYFYRVFKKEYGMTPTEYRNQKK